jgi:hypothetical protein
LNDESWESVLLPKRLKKFYETERNVEDVTHKTHNLNLVSYIVINYYAHCCTEESIIVLKHPCNFLVVDFELVISNY